MHWLRLRLGAAEAEARAAVGRRLRNPVVGAAVGELPGVPGAAGDEAEIGLLFARRSRPFADVAGHREDAVRAPVSSVVAVGNRPGGDLLRCRVLLVVPVGA